MTNENLTYEEFKEMDEKTQGYHIFNKLNEIYGLLCDHRDMTTKELANLQNRVKTLEDFHSGKWGKTPIVVGGIIVLIIGWIVGIGGISLSAIIDAIT